MSKRWFDLIAAIIFVVYLIGSVDFMYSSYPYNFDITQLPVYFGYIIIAFALRRFFYNKR